ncbi:hypothetical protein GQX74_004962 [Glossina fuscipes]|nr:hypothetical protein GQX74_004962 [Glossina fuscipes]
MSRNQLPDSSSSPPLRSILIGASADIARDRPICECRIRCSIKSAPNNSSLASMRIGTILFTKYSSSNVEPMPQHVRQKADKVCMARRYQSPPLKRPERPLVVSKGTGLSAKRPTAITP